MFEKKLIVDVSSDTLLQKVVNGGSFMLYDIPSNWSWTTLGEVTEVVMGQSPKGDDTTDDSSYTPLIGGASDMGELFPKALKYTTTPTKLSKTGDVIISIRATLGKPIFSDGEYCLGRGVAGIRSDTLDNKLIRYYFINFEDYLHTISTGSTFSSVTKSRLENMPFPLPPVAEQQRIVDTIESLFTKLDRAREIVQTAIDSFENRKLAILHKAFTGELTAKWREENGVSFDSWEEKTIGEICDCIVPGRDKPKSFTGSIPWITIPNLQGDFVSNHTSELYLLDKEILEVKAKIIPKGSVVMSCVGRFGISAIVDNECVINQQLHAFLPSDHINNKFLMNNIRYLEGYMIEKATATTIAYLNKSACNSLPIYLPTIAEQAEIVRILDKLLTNEKQAYDLYNLVEKIDLLKKSILARAFRGKLGKTL
ncbi:MAG: hypothetical protein ATN35_01160 [Epulopiscium sp. Nele67-Bin004]|nr:MAG: hypothetical protein ATN35_01160 [Epulopiscium sp. Nele67-Bin004]